MKSTFDCVIVGAGIAGITAGIYLKRANVNVLILDNDAPGGLLNKISIIENYPGFKSITGPDFAQLLLEQVIKLGIEIRYGKVLNIVDGLVQTDLETIETKRVIIATGRSAKKLKLESNIKNISYCAICDGNLYKDKTVAVIGGGNSAFEDAIYLSSLCDKVYLLNRSDSFKADEMLIEQAKSIKNIEIKANCVINTIKEENNILYELATTIGPVLVDGMFISIGYEPNVNFLEGIETDNGYIIVNNKMQTSNPNIYACGDTIKKDVYQLTTAVGEASVAAISVKLSLKETK